MFCNKLDLKTISANLHQNLISRTLLGEPSSLRGLIDLHHFQFLFGPSRVAQTVVSWLAANEDQKNLWGPWDLEGIRTFVAKWDMSRIRAFWNCFDSDLTQTNAIWLWLYSDIWSKKWWLEPLITHIKSGGQNIYRVGLPTTSLPIGEDTNIVAVKSVLHHILLRFSWVKDLPYGLQFCLGK